MGVVMEPKQVLNKFETMVFCITFEHLIHPFINPARWSTVSDSFTVSFIVAILISILLILFNFFIDFVNLQLNYIEC